jgi:hypothetical protein
MSIEERNRQFTLGILKEVEQFHEYFMSYEFEEQLKDPSVAMEFRHAVDMLCRSYIHFINSTLQEDETMEAVKAVDAKEHLGHMQTSLKTLKDMIQYNKK